MSKKNSRTIVISCRKCRNQFDLKEAANEAVARNEHTVHCPHCGEPQGTVN